MQTIAELKRKDLVRLVGDTYWDWANKRQKWEIEWLQNRQFYNGNHYGYKTTTYKESFTNIFINRIIQYSSKRVEDKATQITQDDYVPSIGKKYGSKDPNAAENAALVIYKMVEAILEEEAWPLKRYDMVLNGYIDGVSWPEVYTDTQGIHIRIRDWIDVLPMAGVKFLRDSSMLGDIWNGVIGDYRANEDYMNMDKLHPTTQWSMSDKKENIQNSQYQSAPMGFVDDLGTFVATRWQCPLYIDDKENGIKKQLVKYIDEKGEHPYEWVDGKNKGDRIMRIFSVAQEECIYDRYVDIDRYNIFGFSPRSGPFYQQSKFHRTIGASKSLDTSWSHEEAYIATALINRLAVEKGTTFSRPDNIQGQLVYYEDKEPHQIDFKDVPQGLIMFVKQTMDMIDTLLGLNESTVGKSMSGQKKAQAMKDNRKQDMIMANPEIDRLKETTLEIFKFIVMLLAKTTELDNDYAFEHRGAESHFRVIGEGYKNFLGKDFDENEKAMHRSSDAEDVDKAKKQLVVIRSDTPVKIRVVKRMNEEDLKDTVLQLVEVGMKSQGQAGLPMKALMIPYQNDELLEIIEETEKDQDNMKLQQGIQASGQPANGGQQPPQGVQNPPQVAGQQLPTGGPTGVPPVQPPIGQPVLPMGAPNAGGVPAAPPSQTPQPGANKKTIRRIVQEAAARGGANQ